MLFCLSKSNEIQKNNKMADKGVLYLDTNPAGFNNKYYHPQILKMLLSASLQFAGPLILPRQINWILQFLKKLTVVLLCGFFQLKYFTTKIIITSIKLFLNEIVIDMYVFGYSRTKRWYQKDQKKV